MCSMGIYVHASGPYKRLITRNPTSTFPQNLCVQISEMKVFVLNGEKGDLLLFFLMVFSSLLQKRMLAVPHSLLHHSADRWVRQLACDVSGWVLLQR